MVRLVPMTSDMYHSFLEQAVADFADDKVRSGNWPAEGALQRSRQVFQQFLPQGLDTPDQHIYTITADEDGNELGYLWYGITGEGGSGRHTCMSSLSIKSSAGAVTGCWPCRRWKKRCTGPGWSASCCMSSATTGPHRHFTKKPATPSATLPWFASFNKLYCYYPPNAPNLYKKEP